MRFTTVKINLSSWTLEVRLYNLYLFLVKTKKIVIALNYIHI